MNRSLLTPRWLLLHVLFFAATTATGFLAWWQWARAHEAGGSAQNLGYALMWPLFGAFTVFLWFRLVRLEIQTSGDTGRGKTEEEASAAGRRAVTGSARDDDPDPSNDSIPEGPAARGRPLVPPRAAPVEADEDPELAAYNEYLRELNQVDQR